MSKNHQKTPGKESPSASLPVKHKVLVANRGEIAIRIAKACQRLGVDFVCVYTVDDEASGHIKYAREHSGTQSVFRISSYHDANELLSVADAAKATAVHPGYGFFAEDFRFARRVTERERKLVFIGPSWRVIRDLGDKINTKRLARSLGVPTVPGSDRPLYDESEAEDIARSLFSFQQKQGIDQPLVLIKASAGGGGMGIEEVYSLEFFRSAYRRISNYALRQFKDAGVLIEQRILNFNHLEVQILADRSGRNTVHFGTRNCSIQSTGLQKRLEAAPGLDPSSCTYKFSGEALLNEITDHSLAMARKIGYDSVGTWEWIVTGDGNPYLMEVNTRIQVENGVSTAISRVKGDRVDLLAEQIRLALGQPLGYTQTDITFEGVGLEYRIVTEDPDNNFRPWVGRIECFTWEPQPWLDVHTHIPPVSQQNPYLIPTEYDPNLALAIIWGENLAQAKERGVEFLHNLRLEGRNGKGESLKSDIRFLLQNTGRVLQF